MSRPRPDDLKIEVEDDDVENAIENVVDVIDVVDEDDVVPHEHHQQQQQQQRNNNNNVVEYKKPSEWVKHFIVQSNWRTVTTKLRKTGRDVEQRICDTHCKICDEILKRANNAKDGPLPPLCDKNGKPFVVAEKKVVDMTRLGNFATHLKGIHDVTSDVIPEGHPLRHLGKTQVAANVQPTIPGAKAKTALLKSIVNFIAKTGLAIRTVESEAFIDMLSAAAAFGADRTTGSIELVIPSRRGFVDLLNVEAASIHNDLLQRFRYDPDPVRIHGPFYSLQIDIGTVYNRYITATIRIVDQDPAYPGTPVSKNFKTYFYKMTADSEKPFTPENNNKNNNPNPNDAEIVEMFNAVLQDAELDGMNDVQLPDNDDEIELKFDDDDENDDENNNNENKNENVNDDDQQPMMMMMMMQQQQQQPQQQPEQPPPVQAQRLPTPAPEDRGRFVARNILNWLYAMIDEIKKKGGVLLNVTTDNGSNFLALPELFRHYGFCINFLACFPHVIQLFMNDVYRALFLPGSADEENVQKDTAVPVFQRALSIYNAFRKVKAFKKYGLPSPVLTRWNYDLDCVEKFFKRLKLPVTDPEHIPKADFEQVVTPMKITNCLGRRFRSSFDGAMAVLENFVALLAPFRDFTNRCQHDSATLLHGLAHLSDLYLHVTNAAKITVADTRKKMQKAFIYRLFDAKGHFVTPVLAFLACLHPFTNNAEADEARTKKLCDIAYSLLTTRQIDTFEFQAMDLRKGIDAYRRRICANVCTLASCTTADLEAVWHQSYTDEADEKQLAIFILRLLRASITEASVERVFSILGWVVDDRRTKLLPSTAASQIQVALREPFTTKPIDLGGLVIQTAFIELLQNRLLLNYESQNNANHEQAVNVDLEMPDQPKPRARCVVVGCAVEGEVGAAVFRCQACVGERHFCGKHATKITMNLMCNICTMKGKSATPNK